MGKVIDWLSGLFKKGDVRQTQIQLNDKEIETVIQDLALRELAFYTCVNKISSALAKCEFKTYKDFKSTRGPEWYLWNYSPNKNENATMFLNKLIAQLYRYNEALVIEMDGDLLVADSYSITEYALLDDRFTGVTVNNLQMQRTFYSNEVLYFKLNDEDVRVFINGVYSSMAKMIDYAEKCYNKSRGSRGILDISGIAQQQDNFAETLEKLMNDYFKKFYQSENAVLPLFEGYTYTDASGNTTYTNENSRDIKALMDDVFDVTARALSFPPALAKGDVQDTSNALDEMLTFCIDPLARMLEKEICRKRYKPEDVQNGTYLIIDTTRVKHADIFEIGGNVDKLISSGPFTINDVLEAMVRPRIEEDWADRHFITKNYSTIEDMLRSLQDDGDGDTE